VSLTFVGLVMVLPRGALAPAALGWGMLLLAVLSVQIARVRGVGSAGEIVKHLGVAAGVIAVSRAVAALVADLVR
jgi:hypothetical protein